MKIDPRVLIIDDNINLARGFALALGRAGYDVSVAHTADDGLRLAAERPQDAILLDFRMSFVKWCRASLPAARTSWPSRRTGDGDHRSIRGRRNADCTI